MPLTDHDRRIIAQARELVAIDSQDALEEFAGEDDPDLVYPAAFGLARFLLGEMADIAERAAGNG